MGFFREMRFEVKYMFDELVLKAKHPDRPGDFGYHMGKFWDIVIFHPWYALKRGVVNIYKWFPVIWGTDVWDYTFLTSMMDKQLEAMEKFWAGMAKKERDEYADCMDLGYRCQYRRIYKRIKWTRKLMAMWQDEHYSMEWYDKHSKKYPGGKDRLFGEPAKITYDTWGEPILYECKSMPDEERADYSSGSKIAHEMDKKLLKLWQKNLGFIQHWWH